MCNAHCCLVRVLYFLCVLRMVLKNKESVILVLSIFENH